MEERDANGRWVKGHKGIIGNPYGRPRKDISITELVKLKLGEGEDLKEIIRKILSLAKEGNTTILGELWNRIDGKVKENLELSGGLVFIYRSVLADADRHNEQV